MAERSTSVVTASVEGNSGPSEQRLKAIEALLRDFVQHEDRPCSFDHHGYCQEHGWFGDRPGDCGVRQARELLALTERCGKMTAMTITRTHVLTVPVSEGPTALSQAVDLYCNHQENLGNRIISVSHAADGGTDNKRAWTILIAYTKDAT